MSTILQPSPLLAFVVLLAVHWIADFVLQTHWQATNKSKRIDALAMHVGTYTLSLLVAVPLVAAASGVVGTGAWLAFVAVNGALHFATDFCTSRWTSRLYQKQDWHNFFAVVGFDQLIHQTTLAAALWLAIVYSQ